MGKYIKWELRNFFKKEWKMGVFITVITLLMLIVVKTDSYGTDLGGLIIVPFVLTMFYLFVALFIQGTRVIINTYRKPTFLLESMIAYSPAKILLAKYLIAIILNFMYGAIIFVIWALLLASGGVGIDEMLTFFRELIGEIGYLELFKTVLSLIIYSISFTSLVVMVYIIAKCINPGKAGMFIISVLVWWIIIYIQELVLDNLVKGFESDNVVYLLTMIINLMFIAIYYFVSVKLTRDKLEIYS